MVTRFSQRNSSLYLEMVCCLGVQVSFESGKDILVNNTALTKLGSSPARYPSFTVYKAGLFVIINATHFNLRWDRGRH